MSEAEGVVRWLCLPEELSYSMGLVEVSLKAFFIFKASFFADGTRKYLRNVVSVPENEFH